MQVPLSADEETAPEPRMGNGVSAAESTASAAPALKPFPQRWEKASQLFGNSVQASHRRAQSVSTSVNWGKRPTHTAIAKTVDNRRQVPGTYEVFEKQELQLVPSWFIYT